MVSIFFSFSFHNAKWAQVYKDLLFIIYLGTINIVKLRSQPWTSKTKACLINVSLTSLTQLRRHCSSVITPGTTSPSYCTGVVHNSVLTVNYSTTKYTYINNNSYHITVYSQSTTAWQNIHILIITVITLQCTHSQLQHDKINMSVKL